MLRKSLKKSENSSYAKEKSYVDRYSELLKEGVWAGFGWAMGVTLGFVVLTVMLGFILKSLGGMPFVGKWIAGIVEATQIQLNARTPRLPNP